MRQKFTGYEKDQESGLNFAQARYQSSNLGRFMSPDPLMASAIRINPQTFNRYTYVTNNPLNLTDPLGLMGCPPGRDCIPNEPGDAPGIYRYIGKDGIEVIGSDDDGVKKDSAPAPAPPATNLGSLFDPFNSPSGPLARRSNQSAPQSPPSTGGSSGPSFGRSVMIFTATQLIQCHLFEDCIQLVGGGGDCGSRLDCPIPYPRGDDYDGIVYRGGSDSDTNLAPRSTDYDGLSTFTTIERATDPGKPAQMIDTSRLINLKAILTNSTTGHVSIIPINTRQLPGWQGARGNPHPLTQEVRGAIIQRVVRPR